MEKKLIIKAGELVPSQEGLCVIGVFNPAVTRFNDEIVMLARVAESVKQDKAGEFKVPVFKNGKYCFLNLDRTNGKYNFSDPRIVKSKKENYLTSISHFRVGRSADGLHFTFAGQTSVFPETRYEEYGIEDPRITKIEDTYYITYTAVSSLGINVALMKTDDFRSFCRLGIIFSFDNKDCVIFPEKIKDRYYALHRPSTSELGKLDIWVAESDNLLYWGNHQVLDEARIDYGDYERLGAGAVPFLTEKGWVVIYHGADGENRYHLTSLLLDKDDPHKVLMRSRRPLIIPTESYEHTGFVNEVIFTCGLIEDQNKIRVYYGAGDDSIACCTLTIDEIWDNMKEI